MWGKRTFGQVANNSTIEQMNKFVLLEFERDNSAISEHDLKEYDDDERVLETQFQQDAKEVGNDYGSEGFLNLHFVTVSEMGSSIQMVEGCGGDAVMVHQDGEDDALAIVSDT